MDIIASSVHEIELGTKKVCTPIGTNSFATPFVTAIVCRILNKFSFMNVCEIKNYLKQLTYHSSCGFKFSNPQDVTVDVFKILVKNNIPLARYLSKRFRGKGYYSMLMLNHIEDVRDCVFEIYQNNGMKMYCILEKFLEEYTIILHKGRAYAK